VLGVAANHVFHSFGKPQLVGGTAATIAQSLPKTAWRRLSSGEGTKGPRLHDWAYVELADLEASQDNDTLAGEWTRGLLIRRNIASGDLAFFATWSPKGTPMIKLVAVEGHRWAIEESLRPPRMSFVPTEIKQPEIRMADPSTSTPPGRALSGHCYTARAFAAALSYALRVGSKVARQSRAK
jgi:hypothetical protein